MTVFNLLKVIVLGIVEGITEWLPISSTGHMLLVDEWIQIDGSPEFKEMFFVCIQLGAILAVVLLFWKKMFPFNLTDKSKPFLKKDILSMWGKVVVACIPGAIFTVLFDDFIEAHFTTPVVIATALILYGVAFILIENRKKEPKVDSLAGLTYRLALYIGLFQVLSIVPGTSRSGATIVGALLLGVSRVTAAEFTFFLAVPVMFGLSFLKLLDFGFAFEKGELATLIVGMLVAFGVSLLVIRFLMAYIKKHDFKLFGWYRIALGAIVLLYFLVIRPLCLSPAVPTNTDVVPDVSIATETGTAQEQVTVQDMMSLSGSYTDSVGNRADYNYILPELTGVSTEYAKTVNQKIGDIKEEYVQSSLDLMEEQLSLIVYTIGYTHTVTDGIHSVLIYLYNDWGCSEYWSFCFTDAGEEITNRELLAAFSLTESEFTDKAYTLMEQRVHFSDELLQSADDETKAFYQEVRNKTLSSDNLSADMPLYIDEDGHLGFVGTVYSVAGAESYDQLFSIEP